MASARTLISQLVGTEPNLLFCGHGPLQAGQLCANCADRPLSPPALQRIRPSLDAGMSVARLRCFACFLSVICRMLLCWHVAVRRSCVYVSAAFVQPRSPAPTTHRRKSPYENHHPAVPVALGRMGTVAVPASCRPARRVERSNCHLTPICVLPSPNPTAA